MSIMNKHGTLERHSLLLTVGILIVVAIGGLVEIAPLFYLENTIEKVQGMRPYTPLELKGRNIYIREGCYVCHSQMVRPLRDEVERYGHYSLAAESMYDHPFQWGSKRTGPDLARVGKKYSDEWHLDHLIDPRALVPDSIMPPYAFLAKKKLRFDQIEDDLRTQRLVGVPYSDDMIANAKADLVAQATPNVDYDAEDALIARYEAAAGRKGTLKISDYDRNPAEITEMDALIAYLQMTGTLVDFSTYEADDLGNRR
jgi:cytochrome c oxidase cbb3-type subunit II